MYLLCFIYVDTAFLLCGAEVCLWIFSIWNFWNWGLHYPSNHSHQLLDGWGQCSHNTSYHMLNYMNEWNQLRGLVSSAHLCFVLGHIHGFNYPIQLTSLLTPMRTICRLGKRIKSVIYWTCLRGCRKKLLRV